MADGGIQELQVGISLDGDQGAMEYRPVELKEDGTFEFDTGLVSPFNDVMVFVDDNEIVDAYLQETGMPENEIQKLDEHVKQFIVDDLKNGDGKFEYMKIDVGKQAMNGREEDFEWIEFYASAFQIGSTIYIYPTYEFAENKKPCGNDSFSFLLGEAIRPYEFGGTLWYKDRTMSDWEVSGNLIANNQQLNGASYSGSQLGTPRSAMKFMGTTYCHASVGTGDDNRILMGYSYQPKEVRVELFGWRLSRKQIIFVLAGGVVVGSVWWRKNKGKTQK